MKKIVKVILMLLAVNLYSNEILFEVKNDTGKTVMEVADDGMRIFNPSCVTEKGDTLMAITNSQIKAYIQASSKAGVRRDFNIGDMGSRSGRSSDKVFSVSKKNITAYVNADFDRDFNISTAGSRNRATNNLMKVSNKSTTEAIDDSTMLWYKPQNAFRVNHVVIESPDSVGQGSFASGDGCQAMGRFSTAMGSNARALGNYSSAIGINAKAIGEASFAIGSWTKAVGFSSNAFGYGAEAYGSTSTAMGKYTKAYGNYSTAMGYLTTAKSFSSIVVGRYNKIEGDQINWVATDPLFVIGNGLFDSNRSNAFEVKKNGDTYIPSLVSNVTTNYSYDLGIDANGKLVAINSKSKTSNENSINIQKLENENANLKKEMQTMKREMEELKKLILKK